MAGEWRWRCRWHCRMQEVTQALALDVDGAAGDALTPQLALALVCVAASLTCDTNKDAAAVHSEITWPVSSLALLAQAKALADSRRGLLMLRGPFPGNAYSR